MDEQTTQPENIPTPPEEISAVAPSSAQPVMDNIQNTLDKLQVQKETEDAEKAHEEEEEKKNPQTGPKGIDWVAAKQYYLNDCKVKYADVAKKFMCSTQSVEVHGNYENWVALRKELGERAMAAFEERKVNEIASANELHLKSYNRLLKIALFHLNSAVTNPDYSPKDLKALADVLEKAANGERLVLGLPTSVSKSEILGKLSTDFNIPKETLEKMDAFFKTE
jgi:outer membrane protein OmpA-like peptidoglycan-associated protein